MVLHIHTLLERKGTDTGIINQNVKIIYEIIKKKKKTLDKKKKITPQ